MKLNCPLPKLDFDIITLSHGSGGLLTQRLLNQCIFELLRNEFLDKEDDGAVIHAAGKMAFSTDSFVVSPIFFPGGNIGDLAVNGTVNDVAMCGAVPKYLSLSFIIEEGLAVKELWYILLYIIMACEKANVQIITGDTKVVEKGKGDKIFINTTGIGEIMNGADLDIGRISITDKIILSGPIATHGVTILSQRENMGFDSGIKTDSAPLNHLVEKLISHFGSEIHFLRDATRGGVAAVFNEMVKKRNSIGITINQSQIPVLPAVQDLCEILGLDPLYVANEGVAVIVASSDIADVVVQSLRKMEFGNNAQIIGEISSEPKGKVLLKSGIGGKRIVHMPLAEQLPRIC